MTVTPITSLPEFFDAINGDQIAFVDFWAEGCGPCKAIKPFYEDLSNDPGTVAKFYSVDIGKYEDIGQEVRVTHVPTFMVFKDGNPLGSAVGTGKEHLSTLVAKHAPRNQSTNM